MKHWACSSKPCCLRVEGLHHPPHGCLSEGPEWRGWEAEDMDWWGGLEAGSRGPALGAAGGGGLVRARRLEMET